MIHPAVTVPDKEALATLYGAAFPTEDLVPLVAKLVARDDTLSIGVHAGGGESAALIGHLLFTAARRQQGGERLALLGPLAVHPAHQRRGIGTALIGEGLKRLAADGVAQVLVLGDPGYYARHGFLPRARIEPPYPLPAEWAEAWQWRRLDGADEDLTGKLLLPEPWMQAALWG